MLTIYRRHKKSCPHTSRRYRRCKCPLHVEGSLASEHIRKSLDLTSWEAAEGLIHEWNVQGRIGLGSSSPSVGDAIRAFLADAEARALRPATLKKLETIFDKQFRAFCESRNVRELSQLTPSILTEWRASWADAPLAASKKLQRVRGFFHFCVRQEWLTKNPAVALRMPRVVQTPTLPFTDEEFEKILLACDRYPIKGIYGAGNRLRLRAFVFLLRHSGLRIGDAVSLKRERVSEGKLFLYTAKTGTPVWLPLPGVVDAALSEVPSNNYFFWSGSGLLKSAVADWQRSLRRLFGIARIEGGHAHRFRDTFAIGLLIAGVPIEDVSILLGHQSLAITLKHYSPWVRARQQKLEAAVMSSWRKAEPATGPFGTTE